MAPLNFLFFHMSALWRTHGGWLDVALVGHSPSRRLFSSPHRLCPYTVSPAFKYHIWVIAVMQQICIPQSHSLCTNKLDKILNFPFLKRNHNSLFSFFKVWQLRAHKCEMHIISLHWFEGMLSFLSFPCVLLTWTKL